MRPGTVPHPSERRRRVQVPHRRLRGPGGYHALYRLLPVDQGGGFRKDSNETKRSERLRQGMPSYSNGTRKSRTLTNDSTKQFYRQFGDSKFAQCRLQPHEQANEDE